ncbi:PEP-CTERM sorting domain-containing protein [Roseateles sp. BYS87W]|uniref:PEP-CTERM sorting domain-containing protein n=1 Tax=Pelomonas baiyunensis TaxID=3299026 RepID=A0ABW7GZ57_9BURK
MKAGTLTKALSVSVLVLAAVAAQASGVLGSNLVVNGDAESGAGGNGNAIVAAPGFLSSGSFTVVSYAAGGGFPAARDPGPSSRGSNFFAGGPNAPQSSATQSFDVSSILGLIDGGAVSFELAAYLGGFSSQQDNAMLTATFLGASGDVLGAGSVGPVTHTDRGNATGLLLRQTSGAVPVGTRFIDLQLTLTRQAGSYNDGYADNLSLVLSAVPESSTIAMLGSGLAVLGLCRRRRHAGLAVDGRHEPKV